MDRTLVSTPLRRLLPALAAVIASIAGSQPARSQEPAEGAAIIEFLDDAGRVVEGTHIRVPVDARGSLRIRFRAGPAGIAAGGGIEVTCRSPWDLDLGERLQVDDPAGPDYLAARASRSGSQARLVQVGEALAATHLARVRIEGEPLKAGDEVEIVLGDRAAGGPGLVTPPAARLDRALYLRADARGDGRFHRLEHPLLVDFVPGAAVRLEALVPSIAGRGERISLTVRAEDRNSNVQEGHRGRFAIRVEEEGEGRLRAAAAEDSIELPSEGAFELGGVVRIPGVARRPGVYWIAVEDDAGRRGLSNPIRVLRSREGERLWWGDLDIHTGESDGSDAPEENFRFARDTAALDFAALADRLRPEAERGALGLDPAHRRTIQDGLAPAREPAEWWKDLQAAAGRFDTPPRFAALAGFTWSGLPAAGGDRFILAAPDMPLPAAGRLDDLYRALSAIDRIDNIAVIAAAGAGPGIIDHHRPGLETALEICSARGRFEWFAQEALSRGWWTAFTGGGGGGQGRPGCTIWQRSGGDSPAPRGWGPAGGLAAVSAAELSRPGVIGGLRRRRVYATTGPRILIDFRIGGAPMGERLTVGGPPRLEIQVHGAAPIARVDVIRDRFRIASRRGNGRAFQMEMEDGAAPAGMHYYYVRVTQVDGELAWASPIWVVRTGDGPPPEAEPPPAWNDDGALGEWQDLDGWDHAAAAAELERILAGWTAGGEPFTELTPVREVASARGDHLLFFARRSGRPVRVLWWRGFAEPRLSFAPGWGGYGPAAE